MNKEDILKKSRQENAEFDEREKMLQFKAIKISRSIGLALCFLIVFLETLFLDSSLIGFACLTIHFSMLATENWLFIAMIKKKAIIPEAVINTLFFIAVLIIFLVKLIG